MAHVDKGPPIVTAKNVQDGFMNFENSHRADSTEFADLNPKDRPRRGDILITKDGTIGRAAIVDTDESFCINQSVAVLWLESCLLYQPYMLIVIRSPFAQGPIWEASEGMAIKHLSITDFAKMLLPIPPLAEQHRIVAKVDQLMALVDELERQQDASRENASKLLDAIVQEMTSSGQGIAATLES
jgi:type I restriction enzyme S subunit